MSTIIKLKVIDQVITLIDTPLIASGGINEDMAQFEFDDKWDGFAKVCVYFTDRPYFSFLDSENKCTVPSKVVQYSGLMQLGIVGVKDNVQRTTQMLDYKIENGALDGFKVIEPSQELYTQILANTATLETALKVLKARVDNIASGSTSGDTELTDIRVGYDGKTYSTSGEAVRGQVQDLKNELTELEQYSEFLNVSKLNGVKSADLSISVSNRSIIATALKTTTSGNNGVTLKLPKETMYMLSFDLVSNGGSPNICIGASQFSVYLKTLIAKENYTGQQHIEYILTDDVKELIGSNDLKFVIYKSAKQIKDTTFTINNLKVTASKVKHDVDILKENVIDLKTNKVDGYYDILPMNKQGFYAQNDVDELTIDNSILKENLSGDKSIIASQIIPTSKYLAYDFDINVSTTDTGNLITIELILFDGNGNRLGFEVINKGTNSGHFSGVLDLNYYAVYNNASSVSLGVFSHLTGSMRVIMNSPTIISDYLDLNCYSNNIGDWLRNIESSISIPKQEKNYLVSPTGERYITQVSSDGALNATPVIPNKALFIGNSLLFGFNEYGMCATNKEHDYYYLVSECIKGLNTSYADSKLQGATWEQCETQTAINTWLNDTLKPKLSGDLDLVIIQLGDNVNNSTRKGLFANSSLQLMRYIRANCPKARVVWMGSWYQQTLMPTVVNNCKITGCEFVDIREINKVENQGKLGLVYKKDTQSTTTYTVTSYIDDADNKQLTIVYTVGAKEVTAVIPYESYNVSGDTISITGYYQAVTSSGVATHPSNNGFRLIANKLLYELGIIDSEEYY